MSSIIGELKVNFRDYIGIMMTRIIYRDFIEVIEGLCRVCRGYVAVRLSSEKSKVTYSTAKKPGNPKPKP